MIDPLEASQTSISFRHQGAERMNSGRTSRALRSANRERDQWAEKNVKMADASFSPYTSSPRVGRRPYTAPVPVDVADISSLVSRLVRPNTSSARKAVLWSKPRKEYEFNYEIGSSLKNPVFYWAQFPSLQKHYPGTWRTAEPEELSDIVLRLTKVTVASESRKEDCVTRRHFIEKIKEKALLADIGVQRKVRQSSETPRQELPPLTSSSQARPTSSTTSQTQGKDSEQTADSDVSESTAEHA